MKGHYNIKNVKMREIRSIAIRKKLREEKNKQKLAGNKLEQEIRQLKEKLQKVHHKSKTLMKTVAVLKKKSKRLIGWKRRLVKRVKYHQERRKKKAVKCTGESSIENQETSTLEVETKNRNGKFTESMRFCVMELAGLEVATGKMKPVMETVSELCGVRLSDLPSRQACQAMVDEGHVMAKHFIREKIARCKSFGVHKDGTTRRKVKILDTSVKTDTGETFCLGWSSVTSETGEAIANEAKDKLEELASTSDEGMLELLKKMEYFMSDRAANERKSNRLLEDWRDECLKDCDEEKKKVHHLFCSAHVLLGFHSYVMNGIKKMKEYGSKDFKHPITVLLRNASDLFGPVGDYRGLRNQWEAYCMEKGIKSFIKSYKDNRFNGLFEVAAQVFHHHEDFIYILSSLKSKNAKQTNLLNSLQNTKLILLCECLGLFFHKITGPFWYYVISPKATFTDLSRIIFRMKESLKKCLQDPSFLFDQDSFSFLNFTTSSETKNKISTVMRPEMKEVLKTISDGILTTLNVQMADFNRSQENIPSCAPLTNLICERHFGHLDASQRQRPHSSLHHHSSVILLKQTRKRMRTWFSSLPEEEKEGLWKRARMEGENLRKKHQEKDKQMIKDSIHTLKLGPRDVVREDLDLAKGQMVAVACEDTWYPGKQI